MFTSDTCTNLITHLVTYVALITTIIKCKYVPLIRVHTCISTLLFVNPCCIICKMTINKKIKKFKKKLCCNFI